MLGGLSALNGNISSTKSPKRMTSVELDERDRNAVAYSKAQLSEGDTLVLIQYPTDCEVFDATGFKMGGERFRVHSQKLLATGSKVFEKLFSEWEQTKFRRRNGFLGGLPFGINFVLNLTPPDEGDEAVNLIAELYCSPGIRSWFTAAQRCKVPQNLVGGMDEVTRPKKPKPPLKHHENLVDALTDYGFEPENHANSTIHFDEVIEADYLIASPQVEEPTPKEREDRELEEVLQRSKIEFFQLQTGASPQGGYRGIEEIPAYCPIRHRVGIEKLLQLIEGKEPCFDSAPKIWTLFVLAKYFECTKVVVDTIVSWVFTEPNCQFIEILPEVTLKLGLGLEAPMLVRPAFAILVSEHALTTVSREYGGAYADKANTNQFGRVREDIGEDELDAIQAAAYEFATRVDGVYQKLLAIDWFLSLAEYQKLKRFLSWAQSTEAINESEKKSLIAVVARLDTDLGHFIRGLLIRRLNRPMSSRENLAVNAHRRAESYLKENQSDFGQDLYIGMTEKEKVMTVFSWDHLSTLELHSTVYSNNLCDDTGTSEREATLIGKLAAKHGVKEVWLRDLHRSVSEVNKSMLLAIQNHGFNGGLKPEECSHQGCCWASAVYDVTQRSGYRLHCQKNTFETKFPRPSYKQNNNSEVGTAWETTESLGASVNSDLDCHPFPQPSLMPQKTRHDQSGRDLQNLLRSQDDAIRNNEDSTGNSGVLNLTRRPAVPSHGIEEVPLLGKRPKPHDPFSSDSFPCHARKRSTSGGKDARPDSPLEDPFLSGDDDLAPLPDTIPKLPSPLDRSPDIPTTGATLLPFRHKLDPRAAALTLHNDYWSSTLGPKTGLHPVRPDFIPMIPHFTEPAIADQSIALVASPFFSLTRFNEQVTNHTKGIAHSMLSRSEELAFLVLTDTLVNLDEDQWKFLPLFAGGLNDGSGGVFGGMAPPAPAGAGPAGPGPSFHTGYSMNSRASTEVEYDGISTIGESINTSVAVENGYSDHFDRRRVIAESDDDFHSETFSNDTERYDGKGESDEDPDKAEGKGKATETDVVVIHGYDSIIHDRAVLADIQGSSPEPDEAEDFEWNEEGEGEPFDFGEEPQQSDND